MSSSQTIHTKHIGDKCYRDLDVYYYKGGVDVWTYENKPKGVYFRSQSYKREGSARTYAIGPGSNMDSGYILVARLTNYRPSVLKAVKAHVSTHAENIHALLDAGKNTEALSLIKNFDASTLATNGIGDKGSA